MSEITFSKTKFSKTTTLNTMVNRFNKAVTAAAKAATPMVTPRSNAKAWWNPEVEIAVKKRRECQDERNNNLDPARVETLRVAYNKASAEAKETIIEAKAATMETFRNKIDTNTEPSLVFNTVKRINGTNKKKPAKWNQQKETSTSPTCQGWENGSFMQGKGEHVDKALRLS